MPCKNRECRSVKRWLKQLIESTTTCLEALDQEMRNPSDVERGRRIARICNHLEMEKDQAKLFGLKQKLTRTKPCRTPSSPKSESP